MRLNPRVRSILVRQHADDIAAGLLIALELQHVPRLHFFQQRIE